MDRKYLSPNSYSHQGIRSPSYNSNSDGGPLSVSSETNTAAASRVASGIVSAASRRPSMMADGRHSSMHSPSSHARNSSFNPDGFPTVEKKSKGEWQAEIKKRMWLFDSHNSRLQRRVALGADEMLKEKQRTREFNRARNAPSTLRKGKPSSAKAVRSGLSARKLQGDEDRDTDAEEEELIDKPFASDSEGHVTPDSADEREKDEDEELDEMDDEEELFALMHGGKAEDADFIASAQWGGGGGDGSPGGGAGKNTGHREVGMQSMYGSKADACVATIITTADLAKLIPMPDDALMLRASLSSLQKLERHASELLAHVQREISVQVEDAGVSYARQENKHRRMGQLGSASVHEFRNTAMSRAMQEAASREADFQSHSAGITDGMGGGQEAGVEANLTKFRYEDGGKLTIRPGTAYTDRREIQYGGSTVAGGGADGHGPTMQPYYPPTSHHRPQTGMCHLGLSRTPFSGSTGYSLYDAKTKSKLNMLMNLGSDMSSRHNLYDNINASVEYFSPLRHTIGEMARRDAEVAERAIVEAQLAGSGPNNMQRFGVGGNSGSGTHGSGLPRHGGGGVGSQQPSYDQILGKPGR